MRILLIRPASNRWSNQTKRAGTPSGLLSIAAVLRSRWDIGFLDVVAEGYEHEVEIQSDVFRYGLSNDRIADKVSEFSPDVVGITCCFTQYWRETYETARIVKRSCPAAKVVIGGHHPSGVAEEILAFDHSEKCIDFILIGESEETIVQLVEKLEASAQDFESISSLAFRRDDKPVVTKIDQRRMNVDGLPDPAWDLMDSSKYDFRMSHSGMLKGGNFVDVLFSRGCPIACTFCTSTEYWGVKTRVLNKSRIKSQLASLEQLGWEEVILEDDNILALPKQSQIDIITAFGEQGRAWSLDGGLYYPAMTKEFVQWLSDSGCYRVFLPIENPDVEIMHEHHKYSNIKNDSQRNEKLEQVADWLHEAGVEFYSAIMLGFWGESLSSIKRALQYGAFVKHSLGAMGCAFHWVHPYPFTAMYNATYQHVDPKRRWQDHPEYYCFAKPVYPIQGITLDEAAELVDDAFYELSGTRSRDPSYLAWEDSQLAYQERSAHDGFPQLGRIVSK